jgi:hypothetical protein
MKNVTIKDASGEIKGYVKELPSNDKLLEKALHGLYGAGVYVLTWHDPKGETAYTDKRNGKKRTIKGHPARRRVFVGDAHTFGRGANAVTVHSALPQHAVFARLENDEQARAVAGLEAKIEELKKTIEATEADDDEPDDDEPDEQDAMRARLGAIIARPENGKLMLALMSGDPNQIGPAIAEISKENPGQLPQLLVEVFGLFL